MRYPVQVISLRRSAQRRADFARANAHLPFEFRDAVDGAALADAQLRDPGLFVQPLRFPSRGAYGCALSHLRLWDEAIARDHAVTVAEDDAVFRHDFGAASRAVMALLPPAWDIVLWGWNFDAPVSFLSLAGVSPAVMLFNQSDLRRNLQAFQAGTSPAFPLRLEGCFGLPAYTISPAGARKFRQACFPMRDFELNIPVANRKVPNLGIDAAMARAYPAAASFAAFPPLAATPNERGASTIQPAARAPVAELADRAVVQSPAL